MSWLQDFDQKLVTTLDKLDAPSSLLSPMKYSLLAPGKRIRPRLVFATAELLNISEQQIEGLAKALEIYHCFTLIHDDLPALDNDDFRRGQPSNHKKFSEAQAILAGDALLTLSYNCFFELAEHFNHEQLKSAFKVFSDSIGAAGVLGGQCFEMFELEQSPSEELLRATHRKKTSLLFEAAVMIPVELKKSSLKPDQIRVLSQFATTLGLSFQAMDDLEDDKEIASKSKAHILYYHSFENVKANAIESLKKVHLDLEKQFGNSSQYLTDISNEVLKRIDESK